MNTIQRAIAVLASLAIMLILIIPPQKLERLGSPTSLGSYIEVTDWVGVIVWIMAIAGIAGLLMFVFKER